MNENENENDIDQLIDQLNDEDPNIGAEPEEVHDDFADVELPLDFYDDCDLD